MTTYYNSPKTVIYLGPKNLDPFISLHKEMFLSTQEDKYNKLNFF